MVPVQRQFLQQAKDLAGEVNVSGRRKRRLEVAGEMDVNPLPQPSIIQNAAASSQGSKEEEGIMLFATCVHYMVFPSMKRKEESPLIF